MQSGAHGDGSVWDCTPCGDRSFMDAEGDAVTARQRRWFVISDSSNLTDALRRRVHRRKHGQNACSGLRQARQSGKCRWPTDAEGKMRERATAGQTAPQYVRHAIRDGKTIAQIRAEYGVSSALSRTSARRWLHLMGRCRMRGPMACGKEIRKRLTDQGMRVVEIAAALKISLRQSTITDGRTRK